MALCDRNANCLFIKETNGYTCQCKAGYTGDGSHGNCTDNCLDYCRNEGICLKVIKKNLKIITFANGLYYRTKRVNLTVNVLVPLLDNSVKKNLNSPTLLEV